MAKKIKGITREHKVWEKSELDFLKSLGQNIIKVKKSKKLTSKEVYETLDIDKSNYRRIEAGKTNVSILLLKRIAKALDVDVKELM